ncbi:MAG: ATP-binding protein, partial [Verrucomicrobiota bacterium]|nr:ATP-binding protein [Verrucomicrobiota bacterium]
MIKVDRFFNTAGPVNKKIHYKLDPLHRWDLADILMLINQEKYFLLHAPRQSGKTSCMLALQKYLNERDDYVAIYLNVESAQAARHNVNEGIQAILSELGSEAAETLKDNNIKDEFFEFFHKYGAKNALTSSLEHLSKKTKKPV